METKYTSRITAIIFSLIQSMSFGHTCAVLSSNTSSFTVIRNVPPVKPIAKNDSVAICENSGVVTIPVQANDSSPDGDTLITSIISGPRHGSGSINGKSINYTPNLGFSGRDTITYMVCDKNIAGNCDTALVFITVKPLPSVVTGPTRTICYGDTISVGGPPVAGNTYRWTPNRGLSSYTVSNPVASPADTIIYTLTVTDTLTGCSNSDTLRINVKPVPSADIIQGDTAYFCMGDSLVLTSTNGARFLWSNGDTTKSIVVTAPGVFSIAVTYSNGCVDYSDPTTVVIDSLPLAVAGCNKTICPGDSTTIGSAPKRGLSYKWTPAIGLSSSTVSQPKASPLVTTTYFLTVTDSITGCTKKDSVTVTVVPPPIANAGPDTSVCQGDSVTIGTPAVVGATYSWSPPTGLSSDTVSQPNASPAVTTTYTLTVSNGSCSSIDSVKVTVNPLPVANAGPGKIICPGDSTTIGAPPVAGISYNWSPATGLSSNTSSEPNASPAVTTTYTLTVYNGLCSNTDTVTVTVKPIPVANTGPNKTICKGDSTTIGAPAVAGISYSWSPATGLSSATSSQPNASPAVTTTYTLTVSNGACSSKDSVTVTVNPLPVANAGRDTGMCMGDSITIGAPPVLGLSYNWSPANGLSSITSSEPKASPSVTTTYILTVSNGTCTNTDTVILTILPQPVANAGNDETICNGDSTTIGAPAAAGVSYSWSPSTGLSSATSSQPNASPAITTEYVLTVTNGICSSRDTVDINVLLKPKANAGTSKHICAGDSITIGSSSVAGLTYQWSLAAGLSSPTSSNPKANPASSTQYTLTVYDGNCSGTDTVTVFVNPLPAANVDRGQFSCDASTCTLGGPAVKGDTYVWTPATGLNSNTISQPTANPGETTTYTLVETDTTTGCSRTNSVLVPYNGDGIFTGISPNGDGINDWWNVPVLGCYPDNTVVIVNRWGSEVWSASNYNNSTVRWEGKNMYGADLPDGTYYYTITYNNTQKRGWVFLKR